MAHILHHRKQNLCNLRTLDEDYRQKNVFALDDKRQFDAKRGPKTLAMWRDAGGVIGLVKYQ
jgi:hypothetical protein